MQNRQCTKIDIVKEDIVLPKTANAITARRLNGLFPRTPQHRPSMSPPPPEPSIELEYVEDKYYLHEFRDSTGTFKDANFLVKEDQLGLFTQLLLLQSQSVRKMIEETERKGYARGFQEGNKFGVGNGSGAEREKIRALPWWKRLLNNF